MKKKNKEPYVFLALGILGFLSGMKDAFSMLNGNCLNIPGNHRTLLGATSFELCGGLLLIPIGLQFLFAAMMFYAAFKTKRSIS